MSFGSKSTFRQIIMLRIVDRFVDRFGDPQKAPRDSPQTRASESAVYGSGGSGQALVTLSGLRRRFRGHSLYPPTGHGLSGDSLLRTGIWE
jgi:hypothetical protein